MRKILTMMIVAVVIAGVAHAAGQPGTGPGGCGDDGHMYCDPGLDNDACVPCPVPTSVPVPWPPPTATPIAQPTPAPTPPPASGFTGSTCNATVPVYHMRNNVMVAPGQSEVSVYCKNDGDFAVTPVDFWLQPDGSEWVHPSNVRVDSVIPIVDLIHREYVGFTFGVTNSSSISHKFSARAVCVVACPLSDYLQ